MTQERNSTKQSAYQRTVILENSGSGKSWLAVRLAQVINGAVIDLDAVHWEPGGYGTRRDTGTARVMVREAAAGERWVIEGVYGWLVQEALPWASALIWLNLPDAECIANLRHRGLRGGDEVSFAALVAWADEMLFEAFTGERLRLRSRVEIATFLATLP